MSAVKEQWMRIEEHLLDRFRLNQITRAEFVQLHEELLNYSREDAETYADETIDFLEMMAQR